MASVKPEVRRLKPVSPVSSGWERSLLVDKYDSKGNLIHTETRPNPIELK